MKHSYPYSVVDVFTTEALAGNALAVFPDASCIDDATMQKIARELNLSETAFVLPARREDCAALLSAGNPTIIVAAKDKTAVDRAWIDLAGLRILKGADREPLCVFLLTPTPEGVYARMFAPEYGIAEDPATGSSIGPLAAYMTGHKRVLGGDGARFVCEQGTKMGRRSLLHVEVRRSDEIYVGGHVTSIADGVMTLGSGADSKLRHE